MSTFSLIYEVVRQIPPGKVATYGQIARLIGRDKNSRLVARVLSHASNYGDFPCHRVVNHSGRLVPGWPEQAFLRSVAAIASASCWRQREFPFCRMGGWICPAAVGTDADRILCYPGGHTRHSFKRGELCQ